MKPPQHYTRENTEVISALQERLTIHPSTITLAAPSADIVEVADAADALEKRTISQYLPHKRCLVKKNEKDPKTGKNKIDYDRSWGITAGCCFGCGGTGGCEQFCDPRVGTCCQVPGPSEPSFDNCCKGSAAQGAYDPHPELCNPAAYWPPGRNNCKKKRGLEAAAEALEGTTEF